MMLILGAYSVTLILSSVLLLTCMKTDASIRHNSVLVHADFKKLVKISHEIFKVDCLSLSSVSFI
jgi:hypothetical protein